MEINIRERLDKGVANDQRLTNFPHAHIWHVPHFFSGHCPFLINLDQMRETIGVERFRFEACWTKDESLEREIERL